METLLIILIVVMTVQTCVFTYGNFIDISHSRETSANIEIMKGIQNDYLEEKAQFKKILDMREHAIQKWIDRAVKLDTELQEARRALGLLRNRTNYVEGLKDSFSWQAEREWEKGSVEGEADDRTKRRCFAEGMKVGAEWACGAVGIDVRFEIDGRFDEEPCRPSTGIGRCDEPADGTNAKEQ